MSELMSALEAGAHIVQIYTPRWPGDSPRQIYYVQQADLRRAVTQRLVVRAMHAHRLETDEKPCGIFEPRIWQLKPQQPKGKP